MTTGEMLGFTNRFKAIVESPMKNQRLNNLMADVEAAYNISVLKDGEFNDSNPYVMQLYHAVWEEVE